MLATNSNTLPKTEVSQLSVGRLFHNRAGGDPDWTVDEKGSLYWMFGEDLLYLRARRKNDNLWLAGFHVRSSSAATIALKQTTDLYVKAKLNFRHLSEVEVENVHRL